MKDRADVLRQHAPGHPLAGFVVVEHPVALILVAECILKSLAGCRYWFAIAWFAILKWLLTVLAKPNVICLFHVSLVVLVMSAMSSSLDQVRFLFATQGQLSKDMPSFFLASFWLVHAGWLLFCYQTCRTYDEKRNCKRHRDNGDRHRVNSQLY
jgi:hypothetical protein